jgi:hypothetical protein
LNLSYQISKILKREDVNVVILNQAPPLLNYQVIKNRNILYCSPEKDRIEFEARTLNMYFDMQYFLDVRRKYLKE